MPQVCPSLNTLKIFQGRPENVWGRSESTSHEGPLNVRLAHSLDVVSGRPQDVRLDVLGRQVWTSPGRSNRIFRGRPGDVGGVVLGTNIYRLG